MIVLSFCESKNIIDDVQSAISSLTFGESEKSRLSGIKNSTVKGESIAALCALKSITDSLDDSFDMSIYRDKNGKPRFINSPFHITLSHSNGLSVAALSDQPIGIDIEYVDEERKIFSLADKYFSETEINALRSSENPCENFYLIWTKKEAFSKIHGEGLSMLLSAKKSEIKIDYFKQFMIAFKEKHFFLSLCFDKNIEEDITLIPCEELKVYEIQN